VRDFLDALTFNPRELEETEERLFAIRAMARKYNVLPDDLPPMPRSWRAARRAGRVRGGPGAAPGGGEGGGRAYQEAADALSVHRHEAAGRLAQAMAAELPPLKMERAVFSVEVTEASPGPEGQDDVRFVAATNPGRAAGAAGPHRVGRGAVAVPPRAQGLPAARGDAKTMIFDEIDRGRGRRHGGGRGRRLADLARGGRCWWSRTRPRWRRWARITGGWRSRSRTA
jgi:DNA repair protein RecN (Recombination protein N)